MRELISNQIRSSFYFGIALFLGALAKQHWQVVTDILIIVSVCAYTVLFYSIIREMHKVSKNSILLMSAKAHYIALVLFALSLSPIMELLLENLRIDSRAVGLVGIFAVVISAVPLAIAAVPWRSQEP